MATDVYDMLKEAMVKKAMKNKSVTAYTKGRLKEEMEKKRRQERAEGYGGTTSKSARETWAALNKTE